jgi:hypothetical protein
MEGRVFGAWLRGYCGPGVEPEVGAEPETGAGEMETRSRSLGRGAEASAKREEWQGGRSVGSRGTWCGGGIEEVVGVGRAGSAGQTRSID